MEKNIQLTESIGDFSWNLYEKIQSSDNMVISPSSIYIALAMAAIGGGGNTLEEFKKCLMFKNVQDLAKNLEVLQKNLSQKVDGLQLITVNQIYQGLPELKKDYISLMTKNFNGAVKQVNFSENFEAVRQEINQFVETVTEKKIQNLLAQGSLNNLTRMVLINAIYFKGEWMHQFKMKDTKKETFNLEYEQIGKTIQVDMMSIEETFEYFENQHLQYIALYYKDGKKVNQLGPYKMEIILPRKSLAVFEKINPLFSLKEARNKQKQSKINLKLPRFKIAGASTTSLKEILESLGIKDAFQQNSANFSFMDPNNSIYISDVFHKAMIEVNEKGAEAAASTAVEMRLRCDPIIQKFTCNKPFIYTIIHSATNTPLFIGKFTQPS